MSGELLFTEEEWNAAVPGVAAAMLEYLRPYRTAIYAHKEIVDGSEYGEGWGSGSYLRLGNRVFVLTNQHVACVRSEGGRLAYQFDAQEDIRLVSGDHTETPWPLDLAVLPVGMSGWADSSNQSKPIEVEQIAVAHDPAPTELLTFTGFSGQQILFHYNTLFAKGTCYTAREVELPHDQRFSSRFHFGINYRPDLASTVDGGPGLPLPPGLSGSTVWDTKFVASRIAGIPWTPDLARVTGVVWGWPSGNACLVATRAEYLRSFLLSVAAAQP
ncbi:MAG: hypothetical protein IT363_01895 [Methanoregulaceae archaeon]|nr:hypothetical protein [Methanoregulaceae archaeon]